MRVLRRALPTGIAAVAFCPKQAIVVDGSLNEAVALAAVAIALERCDGLVVVVMMKELMRAVALMV